MVETPTVWKEEVNKALIEYTKQVIQFERNGIDYDLPVQIRKPDETLKIECYPCVTWYNLMDLPNAYRTYNIEHTYVNRNTKEAVSYYTPEPVDMYYQMDFWAKLWGDIDIMTLKWKQSLPPFSRGVFFNLPVTDSLGNKTTVMCLQKDILRRRDTLTEGNKLLHSTITYNIQGYVGRGYGTSNDLIEKVIVEEERR